MAVTAQRITRMMLLVSLLQPLMGWTQDFFHGGVSPQTVARAGIYSPTSSNVTDALTLNPSGLASLKGASGDLILSVEMATGTFSNATNQNSHMRLRPGYVPFGAVGTSIGKSRWSVGAGITPDFLSSVNWHYADAPGVGGANYGSQGEKSEIVAYRGSGGVGFAATKRLSFGAAISILYNQNTLMMPYIFQQNPSLKGLKTLLLLHTRGLGWGGSFGVTGRPTDKLTLSAAYSAPTVVNSHGHALGNIGVQFQALGIPFQPTFTYDARVRVKVPESVIVGGRWQLAKTVGLSAQGDFVHFRSAFNTLPVSLTNGSNADINGFLKSTSIQDNIPLNWSDLYTVRAGIDHTIGEHFVVDGGFTRRSSLVPNGTVTPLTGAIMKNALSTGMQYGRNRFQFAAAYSINFNQTANVGTSGLLSGEYSNSKLTVSTQALVIGTSFRLTKTKP